MPYSGRAETRDGTTYYYCDHCNRQWHYQDDAENCCRFYCDVCGTEHRYEEDAADCCYFYCPECGESYTSVEEAERCAAIDRGDDYDGDYDEYGGAQPATYPPEILDTVASYPIFIPEIEGRPARICSIEQELSSGSRYAAQLLADIGIANDAMIQSYSHAGWPGRAIVKGDGSLPHDGAEVVYSRFNLSDRVMAREFSEAIWRLREMKKLRLVTTNRAAGTHIHISAQGTLEGSTFGPREMAALYEIWSFCEDVIFRLGSAGWQEHRGTSYTNPLPKFMKENPATPGRIVQSIGGSRYYSLNFTRLLTAAQQCRCGACAVGDWGECNCGTLSNGTIEWRVFNASTKPETIHGWLILAHSLTAKAFDYQLGSLPEPNGYLQSEEEKHQWILGWILNECPMTDVERMVLIGLAKRSPGLQIDWEDFERSNAAWLSTLTDTLDDESLHEPQELITPLFRATSDNFADTVMAVPADQVDRTADMPF